MITLIRGLNAWYARPTLGGIARPYASRADAIVNAIRADRQLTTVRLDSLSNLRLLDLDILIDRLPSSDRRNRLVRAIRAERRRRRKRYPSFLAFETLRQIFG